MKFRFLMGAMLVGAFCATPTWAAGTGFGNGQEVVPDKTTAPKPSNYSITLSIARTGTAGGPCTGGAGLADNCPSGSCSCYTFVGTATGSAGNGPVTFYWTDDFGDGRDGYESGCDPAYGDIEITGSKDVESIGFIGAGRCDSSFTPNVFLNGGCYLGSTNVFTVGGAIATCGGNVTETAKTKFTIKGTALK